MYCDKQQVLIVLLGILLSIFAIYKRLDFQSKLPEAALFYKGYLVIPSKIPIKILEILPDFENFDFKQNSEPKLPDFECLDTISLPSKDGLNEQKFVENKESHASFSFISVSYLIILICSLRNNDDFLCTT